jgi:branched-chain amino acid transport system substrate-binding protein
VLNYTATDHFGFDARGRVLLTIDHGKWKLLPTDRDVVKN